MTNLKFSKILPLDIIYMISHLRNRNNFQHMWRDESEYSLTRFRENKCIFVHIPKTAGVSVNMTLFGTLGGGHLTVRQYKKILGPYNFKRYFKFTIVRNPYSRLLSAYLFLKNGGFDEEDNIWADRNISMFSTFNDFVLNWIKQENIYSYNHFKPQFSFLCDQKLIPEVDFIGKFENIDTDFRYICSRLGVSKPLKKLNVFYPPVDWRTFYSDKSIETVYNVYKPDFEIFNYSKSIEHISSKKCFNQP